MAKPYEHHKDVRIITADLVAEDNTQRMAVMYQRADHQVISFTMSEEEASRLMGALEKHFCSDPNCPRHNHE